MGQPRLAQSSNLVLQAREVCKTVMMSNQPLHILKSVSLQVQAAESLAIVGASGSGKSTLLGLLAGLDVPTSGSIHLLQHSLDRLNEDQRAQVRAQHVGFVFQSFQLLPNLTALENVMLPLEIISSPGVKERAVAMLKAVGLGERMQHYPRQLSGGEQQRVSLARAFVCEPDVLFADEPTGNLDTDTGERIIELLFDLNHNRKTTLILVTHDRELARRCDRTLIMSAGELATAP